MVETQECFYFKMFNPRTSGRAPLNRRVYGLLRK